MAAKKKTRTRTINFRLKFEAPKKRSTKKRTTKRKRGPARRADGRFKKTRRTRRSR